MTFCHIQGPRLPVLTPIRINTAQLLRTTHSAIVSRTCTFTCGSCIYYQSFYQTHWNSIYSRMLQLSSPHAQNCFNHVQQNAHSSIMKHRSIYISINTSSLSQDIISFPYTHFITPMARKQEFTKQYIYVLYVKTHYIRSHSRIAPSSHPAQKRSY